MSVPKSLRVLGILLTCFWTLVASKDANFDYRTKVGGKTDRLGKMLPVFQVVRFPNDPCEVAGGPKNGTCYTEEECSNLGGTNGGSCAEGFGVCCIITLSCGSSTSENCTYFEVSDAPAGACRAEVCRASPGICSIRLDFTNFVISGPNTLTITAVKLANGQNVILSKGVAHSMGSRCITDKFTISNQIAVPEICGTVTGQHVYFDVSNDCNSLDFTLGSQAVGLTALATRQWSIKITQISCMDQNRPPSGCDQWYTGTQGSVQTFNFGTNNRHLGNQHQNICFRREQGYCLICFSADSPNDVSIGGWILANKKAAVAGSMCCAYGTDGAKEGTGGYDCIMIPGAVNAANTKRFPDSQCGNQVGLVTKAAANTAAGKKTVCSFSYPFRLDFFSDGFEHVSAATDEAVPSAAGNYQHGFKLTWFQRPCTT